VCACAPPAHTSPSPSLSSSLRFLRTMSGAIHFKRTKYPLDTVVLPNIGL
jgi:hypothetical protein